MKAKHSQRAWLGLAVCALVCCAAAAGTASGLEFQAGAGLKGGGGSLTLSEGTGIKSPPLGWGVGANVFAGIKPLPIFSLGVNFDYIHYWHEDTTTNQRTNGSLPSLGLYARYNPVDTSIPNGPKAGWGGGAWANYVFGSIEALTPSAADPTFVRPDTLDLGGWQFGAQVFYQYRLGRYKTFIEAGAYLAYNTLTTEVEQAGAVAGSTVVTRFDSSYLCFGVLLQATFDFGRGK
jgi:hypothetical protein